MSNAAQTILDQVIYRATGLTNPYALDRAREKFAFDIRLPEPATDVLTGARTWTQSVVPAKFVALQTVRSRDDSFWMRQTREPTSLRELLTFWNETNLVATERMIDATDVFESDNVYNSSDVHRSLDVHDSKHVLWCDTVSGCEFVVASQRSNTSQHCLRLEDSHRCSDSVAVSWSGRVSRSAFIHDGDDMVDCLFCSHLSGKRFCIANMQFDEATYLRIRTKVMRWILSEA